MAKQTLHTSSNLPGGAPYACATAALLGDRAAGLLLVCPLMPAAGREEELLSGVSPSTLRLAQGARHHPWRVWATLHALRLLQVSPLALTTPHK